MSSLRTLTVALGLAGALTLAAPQAVEAQEVHFGPQVSIAEHTDLGIGGRAMVALAGMEGFEVVGSFDYFFPEGPAEYFEINGNLHYNFSVGDSEVFFPYVGGGLNYAHASASVGGFSGSSSDVGLNLVGGTKFQAADRFIPFAEFRLEAGGGEQFVVTGGLIF